MSTRKTSPGEDAANSAAEKIRLANKKARGKTNRFGQNSTPLPFESGKQPPKSKGFSY